MNHFFEDPQDLDRDVLDLLAAAGPPPEEQAPGLLFRPRPDSVLHSVVQWNEYWRAHLDNTYYFRSDVADEVFEFDGVKCSVVKNVQWMEALESRSWSRHEVYGYNGYALFKEVPYLVDAMTGSLEDESAFTRGIEVHGGIDLAHLDEHGWLCSFTASHEEDRDNPGRTHKLWIREQIIQMVISVRKQVRAPQIRLYDLPDGQINRATNVESGSVDAREVFSLPCDWGDEITGRLARAVLLYLAGKELSSGDIGALRTYFRQWIQSRVWDMNPHATIESRRNLRKLRELVDSIHSNQEIGYWLHGARSLGMSPVA